MNEIIFNEQEEFGVRLCIALAKAGFAEMTYPQFTKQFNARSKDKMITKFAARKWMHGEAIPTQERLLVITGWLHVNPEWLRFGATNDVKVNTEHANLEDEMLSQVLATLNEPAKQLVRELIGLLLEASHSSPMAAT